MELDCTVVFEKNWDAINLKCFIVKPIDDIGNFKIYEEDEDDVIVYKCDQFFDLTKYKFEQFDDIAFISDTNKIAEKKLPHLKTYLYNRYKYIFNVGSSRSSKTYSIIDCLDLYARKNRNKRLTAWRDTKKLCKDTILADTLKHHKLTNRYKRNYTFHKTTSIFYYGRGSTVEMHGTDDEENVHGLTQDIAWLNEPYKISEETFDQIDQRTNDCVIIDMNPKKKHWSDAISKDPRCIIIHSTFKDNPFCPKESRRKLLSYQTVKFSQIVIDGKLTEDAARNYNTEDNPLLFTRSEVSELARCKRNEKKRKSSLEKLDYMWQVYGLGLKAEKPNKIYSDWKILTALEFDKLPYKSYFGLDFGETNPTALVECKYHDGTFYFKELIYLPGREIKSLSETLKTLGIDSGGKDYIICDSADPTAISDLRTAGFYAIGAAKGPGSVVAGIRFLNKMGVKYTSTSHNIDDEYEGYEWEVDRYNLSTDEPVKKDDHLLDAMRYVAVFLKTYLKIKV